jgi:hypothetical protein
VIKDLRSRRYEIKDLVLNYAFALPVYLLLCSLGWWTPLVIFAHVLVSYFVLMWQYKKWVTNRLPEETPT